MRLLSHTIKILFLLVFLSSCASKLVEKDIRQIKAKDEIRSYLPERSSGFDITGFAEDTIPAPELPARLIRYRIDFIFKDSLKNNIPATGYVFFTADGNSVIKTQIRNRDKSSIN
ncbi:MAG: hypothetical protein ACJ75F_00950 [Flavisolibacter sp.]|jgi:hypothetical protein